MFLFSCGDCKRRLIFNLHKHKHEQEERWRHRARVFFFFCTTLFSPHVFFLLLLAFFSLYNLHACTCAARKKIQDQIYSNFKFKSISNPIMSYLLFHWKLILKIKNIKLNRRIIPALIHSMQTLYLLHNNTYGGGSCTTRRYRWKYSKFTEIHGNNQKILNFDLKL